MAILAFVGANWRIIGLLLIVGGAWAYVATITHQRDSAREDVKECKAHAAGLEAQIEVQNRAVQALKDESDRKTKDATKKLAAARIATKGAETEAQRLRSLPAATGACPAGQAVAKVRAGLK